MDDDRDRIQKEKIERSKEQLNALLAKHGWKLHKVSIIAMGTHVLYEIIRTADGVTAQYGIPLHQLLDNAHRNAEIQAMLKEEGYGDVMEVDLILAVSLLTLARVHNKRNPSLAWGDVQEGDGPLDQDRTAPLDYDRTRRFSQVITEDGWTLTAYVGGFFYVSGPGSDQLLVSGNAADLSAAKAKAASFYRMVSEKRNT